jgi:membrane protease subunit HflK
MDRLNMDDRIKLRDILQATVVKMAGFSRWIIICLILLYLLSGIYSVSSNEVGILQRFGKTVESGIQPGIHITMPWPVDRVTKVPVRVVTRILIDDFSSNASDEASASRLFSEMTGLDSYCFTGDNNLVNILFVVQYNIIDPVKYKFHINNPETILRSMAANTVVHCLASTTIDEALTAGKQAMVQKIKQALQERLDSADSGMNVSFIEINSIKPPDRVQEVFSDVVRANIDREKMVNDAEAYRNEKIPAANANASRILEEAEAYKKEVVLKAEGETDRFLNLLAQSRLQGSSVRKMIYIEAVRDIMKNVGEKKIIISDEEEHSPARFILDTAK